MCECLLGGSFKTSCTKCCIDFFFLSMHISTKHLLNMPQVFPDQQNCLFDIPFWQKPVSTVGNCSGRPVSPESLDKEFVYNCQPQLNLAGSCCLLGNGDTHFPVFQVQIESLVTCIPLLWPDALLNLSISDRQGETCWELKTIGAEKWKSKLRVQNSLIGDHVTVFFLYSYHRGELIFNTFDLCWGWTLL